MSVWELTPTTCLPITGGHCCRRAATCAVPSQPRVHCMQTPINLTAIPTVYGNLCAWQTHRRRAPSPGRPSLHKGSQRTATCKVVDPSPRCSASAAACALLCALSWRAAAPAAAHVGW